MGTRSSTCRCALLCFGGALLAGALFWIVDAVLDYLFFHENLRFLLLEGPQNIWESLFTRMTLDDLVDRIVFCATSLVMGTLIFIFLCRQEKARRALAESEATLSSIFRAVPTGIAVFEDRRFMTVNERFCVVLGYEPEELIGRSTRLLYASDEDFERFGAEIYNQIKGSGRCSVEIPVLRKDGTGIFVLFNGSPLPGVGRGRAITASVLDITDRKRAETELKESQLRFKALHDASFGGIGIHEQGVILECNKGLSEITGYSYDELVGMNGLMLIAEQSRDLVLDKIKAGYEKPYEVVGLRKDGEEYPLRLEARNFPYKGRPVRGTEFRDITDHKKAQAELIRYRDELEEMVRERTEELTATVDELQRRTQESETLSRFGDLLQACETDQESFSIVASLCERLFPCHSGFMGVFDDGADMVRPVALFGGYDGDEEFDLGDCWALRRGGTHYVDSAETEPICPHTKVMDGAASLCVPVGAKGGFLGLFHVQWRNGGASVECCEREVGAVRVLAKRVAELYALSLSNIRLRARLRQQSIRDRLTGLYNRRHMEETLGRELSRARRLGKPLGVIMIDVDHFKRFNDTYGHETGDAVLRQLGKYLLGSVRSEDIPCRFGGEELLLILPDGAMQDSCARAESIRRGIEEDIAVMHNGSRLQVTASLGVAAYPAHGEDVETLLGAADAALYRAKEGGRNRVVGCGQ